MCLNFAEEMKAVTLVFPEDCAETVTWDMKQDDPSATNLCQLG